MQSNGKESEEWIGLTSFVILTPSTSPILHKVQVHEGLGMTCLAELAQVLPITCSTHIWQAVVKRVACNP